MSFSHDYFSCLKNLNKEKKREEGIECNYLK